MAPSPFSLILRLHPTQHNRHIHRLLRRPFVKHFSASSPNQADPSTPPSFSARLSFVFDQIDQIEKERTEKDGSLERIRAWRESSKPNQLDTEVVTEGNAGEPQELGLAATPPASNDAPGLDSIEVRGGDLPKKEFELVHPWPEWIEFIEMLVQHNYFDPMRKNEDQMIERLGLDPDEAVEECSNPLQDLNTVVTATNNFSHDRFDILRSLSRHHIKMLVGYGCANTHLDVVLASKFLRKYVGLDEGDVCSACNLRNSCYRAYRMPNRNDEATAMHILCVLSVHAFERINGLGKNKSMLKKKSVKTAARKLLHEVVKLSSVPIDPNLPRPIIKKPPAPKVKEPSPPRRMRLGRDDIQIREGNWFCDKCTFLNFSRNRICLNCDTKRPKIQLLPGEWECPKCDFLNYRRNKTCFHCEHKRPPDNQERKRGSFTIVDRVVKRKEVSNAWNFDFDDDESDGADVAAFERADAYGTPDRSDVKAGRLPRTQGTGFDDFADEEDDVEVEDASGGPRVAIPTVKLSDISGDLDDDDVPKNRINSRSRHNVRPRGRGDLVVSDDDDVGFGSEDDTKQRSKAPRERSSGKGFDSDDDDVDFGYGSDDDGDFGSRRGRGGNRVSDKRDSREYGGRGGRGKGFGSDDDDDDDDGDFVSRRGRGGNRVSNRRDSREYGGRGGRGKCFGSDDDDDDDSDFVSRRGRGGNRVSDRRDSRENGGRGERGRGFDSNDGDDDDDFGSRREREGNRVSDRRDFIEYGDRGGRGRRGFDFDDDDDDFGSRRGWGGNRDSDRRDSGGYGGRGGRGRFGREQAQFRESFDDGSSSGSRRGGGGWSDRQQGCSDSGGDFGGKGGNGDSRENPIIPPRRNDGAGHRESTLDDGANKRSLSSLF